ncbi:hypothetical protein HY636_06030 [Candidatus Woesearchaeota archaeon]|nr:hypothetical protein [Candidatus Woesearchaeota archaeon]
MVLEQLGISIVDALGNLLLGVLSVIPGLIAAFIVLLVGYIIGWIIYKVLDKLFIKIKFDDYLIQKTGLKKRVGDLKLGHVLAVISKWYIFVLFLSPAAGLIKLTTLSTFLVELSFWIPNLIAGLLLLLFGILVADYVSSKIEHVKIKNAVGIGYIAKVVVLIFAALLALDQIGIHLGLAQNTFLVIIGGLMLGVGIALGLGYGLALKDTAKEGINKWKKMF